MKVMDDLKAHVEAVEKWLEDMKAHIHGAPKPPVPAAPVAPAAEPAPAPSMVASENRPA